MLILPDDTVVPLASFALPFSRRVWRYAPWRRRPDTGLHCARDLLAGITTATSMSTRSGAGNGRMTSPATRQSWREDGAGAPRSRAPRQASRHTGELYPADVRAPPPLTAEPAALGPRVAYRFAGTTSSASVEPAAMQQGDRSIGAERAPGRVSHGARSDTSAWQDARDAPWRAVTLG